MQAKKLKALDHAPFNPSSQGTKTTFSGFKEDAFSAFGKALMFASTMLRKHVVASKPHVAQLACHRAEASLAKLFYASRLWIATVVVVPGQALRCQVFSFFALWLNQVTWDIRP